MSRTLARFVFLLSTMFVLVGSIYLLARSFLAVPVSVALGAAVGAVWPNFASKLFDYLFPAKTGAHKP